MAGRPIPVLIQVRIPTTNMQSENDSIDMSIPGTCEVYRKEDVDAYIADLEQQIKKKDSTIKILKSKLPSEPSSAGGLYPKLDHGIVSKLAPKKPLRAPYGLDPKLMDRVGPFDED